MTKSIIATTEGTALLSLWVQRQKRVVRRSVPKRHSGRRLLSDSTHISLYYADRSALGYRQLRWIQGDRRNVPLATIAGLQLDVDDVDLPSPHGHRGRPWVVS